MQINHTIFSTATRRWGASAVAFVGLVVSAGCASSGTSAGTYGSSADGSLMSNSSSALASDHVAGTHIVVSLGQRKLYLRNGDQTVETYSIGVGKESMPTPQGDYSVSRIVWNPPWTPPDAAWADGKEPQEPGAADNPMKVVKIYFKEPDYYIHGTGTVSSLGGAVSHGCLRMAPSDAAALARYLMDHGGASRDASWFEQVQSSNETRTVNLSNSIPMHVES